MWKAWASGGRVAGGTLSSEGGSALRLEACMEAAFWETLTTVR